MMKSKGVFSVKRFQFFLVVIMLSILIIGCDTTEDLGDNVTEDVEMDEDYPVASSIDDLTKEADIIVIGQFLSDYETWNMARDPKDVQKEDKNNDVEGKLYSFEVFDYLKGNGKDFIEVNMMHTFNGVVSERYFEPNVDRDVLLFLYYNNDFDHYYGVMEPFQFEVDDSDHIEVLTSVSNVKELFEKENLSIKDVKTLLNK